MTSYSKAIYEAFNFLMSKRNDVIILGQGLWSPWYVGNTMNDLEKKFGKNRIIDSPVSEAAVTGIGVGASLSKLRPIVVHPRMDFMILGTDQIINQATKWKFILGGQTDVKLTIRSIINRGGEQGAQHSQSLYSMYANIPSLDIVLPANSQDAHDMLIGSVLSNRPTMYIDDRWLYDEKQKIKKKIINKDYIKDIKPQLVSRGNDLTIVTLGYGVKFAKKFQKEILKKYKKTVDIIDLRKINDIDPAIIVRSVLKTKNLVVIDFGWKNCGISSEVIATCCENISGISKFNSLRLTLPNCPAPTNKILEKDYYLNINTSVKKVINKFFKK